MAGVSGTRLTRRWSYIVPGEDGTAELAGMLNWGEPVGKLQAVGHSDDFFGEAFVAILGGVLAPHSQELGTLRLERIGDVL